MKKLLQLLLFCLYFGSVRADVPPDNQQVITIPVVVQIHYSNYDLRYKLTMAQVESQIDALNRDFSATNADFSIEALQKFDDAYATNFAQVAAKNPLTGQYGCQIQFALAQQNAAGEGCTGVVYFAHNELLPALGDGFSIVDDEFPLNQYLHISVAPKIVVLGKPVRGYAGGFGCLIKSDCFSTLDTDNPGGNPDDVPPGFYLDPKFKEGGVVTHEIGHVLGLDHLWEDDISETPSQPVADTGCQPPYAHPVFYTYASMSMNYMDYTDDPCIYMFCQQQRDIMRKKLFGYLSPFIDDANKGLEGPVCLKITGLKHTLTFPEGINKATVDLIWDDNGGSGYRVKVFTKDTSDNWELVSGPIETVKPHYSISLAPDKIYKAAVYAKCPNGSYSYPQEIIFDVPDFANAIPLTGLDLTANLATHTSGKLCGQDTCESLYDVYSFDTYTAPMPSFKAMLEDASGMSELYVYYTICAKTGEGRKLECGEDSVHFLQTTDDDPEFFDASEPGWKPRETIYKPCDGARYKYYIVVTREKNDPEASKAEIPYDLGVSLLSDYPICSSKSRMGGINAGDAQAEISPNPSHGIYHINSSQTIHSITVTDNAGRMILQTDSPDREIDLTNYSAGIYVARIVTDKGVITKKLIKQ